MYVQQFLVLGSAAGHIYDFSLGKCIVDFLVWEEKSKVWSDPDPECFLRGFLNPGYF